MPLRPPPSTLFPYTTLFRSCDVRLDAVGPDGTGELLIRGPNIVSGYWNKPEATAETMFGPDRKSTRLNSSHVEISYAVFCLKKEKMSVHILLRSDVS